MRAASYQHSSYANRGSFRRRAAAVVVALTAEILLVLMLLRLASPGSGLPEAKTDAAVFQLLPEGLATPEAAPVRKMRRADRSTSRPTAAVTPLTVPTTSPLNMVTLSEEEFAASDISKLPSHPADPGGDVGGERGSRDSAAVGRAPNGEPLYAAEWYREPTDAELSFYLPPRRRAVGEAMIACQTVEKYHVDNCIELGDAPPGSGLARAIRQAAWQFLVRPPRIGGRPLIGAWVRIRIEFNSPPVK